MLSNYKSKIKIIQENCKKFGLCSKNENYGLKCVKLKMSDEIRTSILSSSSFGEIFGQFKFVSSYT